MFELLMIIQMSQAMPVLTAEVKPCVWPNKCAKPAPAVVQYQPCVWPRKCAKEPSLQDLLPALNG